MYLGQIINKKLNQIDHKKLQHLQTILYFIKAKTFEELFEFPEENKHNSDFSLPPPDEMKKLTDPLAKHKLTDSALYKSYNAILNPSVTVEEPKKELPPLDKILTDMLHHPLPASDTDLVKNALSKLSAMIEKLSPEARAFYDKNIAITEEKSVSNFHESIVPSSGTPPIKWYEVRKFRIPSSIARTINNARNETTRYAHFTRYGIQRGL